MDKGEQTPLGIYLGERVIDREKRLLSSEAVEHFDAYYELGHELAKDRDKPENVLSHLQDKTVAFVFQTEDGEEVVVAAEDFYRML